MTNSNHHDHLDPISAVVQVGFYTALGLARVLVEQVYRAQESQIERERRIKSATEQALDDNLSELERLGATVENQIYDWSQRVSSLLRPRPDYYVNSGAPLLQPYSFDGVKLYAFVLEAKLEKLNNLCQTYSSISGGDLEYIPLTNQVILTCQTLGETQSDTLTDRSKGFFSRTTNLRFQDQALNPSDQLSGETPEAHKMKRSKSIMEIDDGHASIFWILAQAGRRYQGQFKPERIVACPIYMFLDNVLALVASREIYGFPAEWGWFDVVEEQVQDQRELNSTAVSDAELGPLDQLIRQENSILQQWSLNCLGREKYKALEEASKRPLLHIRQADPQASKSVQNLLSSDQLIQSLYTPLKINDDYVRMTPSGLGYSIGPRQYLRDYTVPFVLLKQFRDLAQGQQACYQSVVEASCQLDDFLLAHQINCEYEMDLYCLESHPILEDFGFKIKDFGFDPDNTTQKETVPISAAFWVHLDFSIHDVKTIWKSV